MATAPARAEPSTAPSSTAPVAVPTSPVSPPQHPMDGLCFTPLLGTQDPSSWGNQPLELLATAVPSGMASFYLPCLPSVLPSLLPFFSFPLPSFSLSLSRTHIRLRAEAGAAPLPVLCPPRPCCCRTRLFAPHHPPSAVCGVPCVLPCSITATPTPNTPLQQRKPPPQPLQCPAWLRVQRNTHPPTLQCTGQLGVQCNPPPT